MSDSKKSKFSIMLDEIDELIFKDMNFKIDPEDTEKKSNLKRLLDELEDKGL